MPVGGGVCGGDDEEDEDDDPPDARRADHVEGTSRPSGETHPMPVTTTLRRGGASAWAGMLVLMVRAKNGQMDGSHGLDLGLGGGFVAVCGKPGRLARDTIAFLDDDVDNHQAELD